jgi:hypothetical protein
MTCAFSGEIVQPQAIGAWNLAYYSPMGQTFTAEDAQISTIGFSVYRATYLNGDVQTLTYELRQGSGATSGTPLASVTLTMPQVFNGFADADFRSVSLTVGQVYTVVAYASPDYLVRWNQFDYTLDNQPIPGRIDYTGGEMIQSGALIPYGDLTFRIEPIPEPSDMLLLVSSAGVALFCHMAKRQLPRPQNRF